MPQLPTHHAFKVFHYFIVVIALGFPIKGPYRAGHPYPLYPLLLHMTNDYDQAFSP